MAGNTRFESSSASHESGFVGNYQNGQRGYSAPTLGRSASFREGAEGRIFNSAKANPRGGSLSSGDVPAISQCLNLEPIYLGEQKPARQIDLRRVLSFSSGNSSEDSSFAASHFRTSPPVAVEELKRIRASVADTCVKASVRVKTMGELESKLNRFVDVTLPKKQQRSELPTNERSSASTLKIGSQMHRNPMELGNQKFDDRPKNVGLNKRPRTSMTDNRVESRNNMVVRQPLLMTKERELIKDTDMESESAEEKVKRLPAGGEGWDKKMKRKRSVGPISSRSVDNDVEMKRTMHHKLGSNESNMYSSDSTHGFRSGASGSGSKLDSTSSPAGSNTRITSKTEPEMPVLSRDPSAGPIKERALGKVNVRLNNREDNNSTCPSPLKGKASRAPRSGSLVAAANSGASIPRVPGTLESWEQPPSANRTSQIVGANNRKRAIPAASASPPITQWGGQRLNKNSRNRRTNLIPIPNQDDVQMQSEGGSPSDFGPRLNSGGAGTSVLPKTASNGTKNIKLMFETVPSPARLSESEESGAGENIREREESEAHAGPSRGHSAIPIKKNKIMAKEETGDGVRRQGRNGRVSPFSRVSMSPTRDKLDNVVATQPLRNPRSGSDKSGSKTGRPLKKLSDRKGFSRLGNMANGGSPDCSGESEDDREELLEAANLAWNSSSTACSSAYWKTSEALFAALGPNEQSYLSEQLKLAEESCAISPQDCGRSKNMEGVYGYEETAAPDSPSHRRNGHMNNETIYKDSLGRIDRNNNSLTKCLNGAEKYGIATPIYQRVLSALIMEDEIEESEETGFGRTKNLTDDSCVLIETENNHMDRIFGAQAQKNGNGHFIFSCNGNANLNPSVQGHPCNGELLRKDGEYVHSEVEVLVLSRCDYVPRKPQSNHSTISAIDDDYEHMPMEEKIMLELQSLDLFVEAVPALDDKEDETINQEIAQLQKGLHEQVLKKKRTRLDKIHKAVEDSNKAEQRDPEQVAMDKLVELSFKKLLATKGSMASKHRMTKVSKPAALTFARRTLAKCRKFEDSRASCFSEPPLRDILYAPAPQFDEKELLTNDIFENQSFAKNGPISNRGKKKEVLLDDVGGPAFRASSTLGILGGAKGKRSEREASARNAKGGRASMGGSKGERKNKSKPKQRTAQLSTTPNGFVTKLTDTPSSSGYPSASGSGESAGNSGNKRKDVRFMSSNNAPPVSTKDKEEEMDFSNMPMDGIDSIGELGVDMETGAPQDLNSWLDFDEDGLHETDTIGLDIPMDDLSSLF